VFREYRMENFGFDDTLLKTFSMGKHEGDTNASEGERLSSLSPSGGQSDPIRQREQPTGASTASYCSAGVTISNEVQRGSS